MLKSRLTFLSKLVILVSFFLCCNMVYAQKLAKASFEDINKSHVFPPVIKLLTKEEKYKFAYPTHLSYYNRAIDIQNDIFGISPYFGVKAKYNESKPDYIFEIVMNGVENIIPQPPRWQDNNVGNPKGIVKDITCNFPCSVVVKTSDGTIIKNIPIFGKDQVFTTTYNTGYLTGAFGFFGAPSSADTSYKLNRDNIHRKMEAEVAAKGYGMITLALQYLFSEYNTSKLPYPIAGVKMKNRDNDYSLFDSANVHFKTALTDYLAGEKSNTQQLLKSVLDEYQKILDGNAPGTDANVKDMVHYNMSLCSMFLGDFTGAWDYFNKSVMKGIDEGAFYKRDLRDRISLYQFRNTVENAGNKL